jgi:hypothetical protein
LGAQISQVHTPGLGGWWQREDTGCYTLRALMEVLKAEVDVVDHKIAKLLRPNLPFPPLPYPNQYWFRYACLVSVDEKRDSPGGLPQSLLKFCSSWAVCLILGTVNLPRHNHCTPQSPVFSNDDHKPSWVPVAHACNSSYSWGRDQEDHGSKPDWANSLGDPILKIPNTKYVEHVPSKCKFKP